MWAAPSGPNRQASTVVGQPEFINGSGSAALGAGRVTSH